MSSSAVVVGGVSTSEPPAVDCAEYDRVIKAFSAHRANDPLASSELMGGTNTNYELPEVFTTVRQHLLNWQAYSGILQK